jgi:diacylglycerol kinase (ATP)
MWLVLSNPTSGGGEGERIRLEVLELLRQKTILFKDISSESYLAAGERLRETLREKIAGVIVIGGDGMVHLAIQELAHTRIPLALVPAGTGNDFARSLGQNLSSPLENLVHALENPPTDVDLGLVNGKYFAEILSTGFDSVVNERANRFKRVKGRMKYNIAILLVLSTFKPKRYRFRVDGVSFESEAMLIAISNGQSYGGGMRVTPDASIDDGQFDVMILGPVSRVEFLRVFPKVFSGAHVSHPAVKILKGKEVEVHAEAVAYADGERIGNLPIKASIQPHSLLTWRM